LESRKFGVAGFARLWLNFSAMEYEAVIGLETHVQLKTKSKMWCGCANQYGSGPNTNVCPVCLGLPGVLPVPNDETLRLTVLTGLLLNCEIPRSCGWHSRTAPLLKSRNAEIKFLH
jgi:Asp-tRNA(Asn)/Glu-tRNA(Gln) amidotransferase B subunit